jgi:hypothetical protein
MPETEPRPHGRMLGLRCARGPRLTTDDAIAASRRLGAMAANSGGARDSRERPMPQTTSKDNVRRAKSARRSFAFYSPRPQLLEGFTKESRSSKTKPSDGDFVAATRGSVADAFFGASPVVASALGVRLGATPRGRIHCKPSPSTLSHKEDISTLLGIGHFYFALTGVGQGRAAGMGLRTEPPRKSCRCSVRGIPGTTHAAARDARCTRESPRRFRCYILPINKRMTRIRTINPRPPLG